MFWPFMFRIHLWVVVVALVAVSVAGGGAEDIDAIFPPRLAAVLKKVADAKSISLWCNDFRCACLDLRILPRIMGQFNRWAL